LWVTGQINLRSGGGLARTHWAALRDLFPAYQCITVVSVFCNDRWLLDKPLAQHLLALHGQFAGHSDSVHDVVHAELRGLFQQRLTAQAATEFQLLQELLHSVNLDYTPDKRTSFFEDDNHRLMSGLIYRTWTRGDHECPSFKFIWRN
jgi:hypothetical protein